MALQTARAGSKSVPNKNLYKLNGVPLYVYNVKHALASVIIQKLYISTDCEDIIKACQNSANEKLKVIVRPASLCQDNSSHYDAIMHGLETIEKENGQLDILVILLGNTPYAYNRDLDVAIKGFLNCYEKYDSCMSVSKFNMFNPFRSFHQLDEGGVVPIIDERITSFLSNRKNKNDKDAFGDIFFFNGSFWICKRETLVKNEGNSVFPWLGKRIMPFFQQDGIMEIDAEWQLNNLKL